MLYLIYSKDFKKYFICHLVKSPFEIYEIDDDLIQAAMPEGILFQKKDVVVMMVLNAEPDL